MNTASLCALSAALLAASAPASAAGAPRVMAHLASYKNRTMAERGWHVLADQYSSVLYFEPQIRSVDLPGKGRFLRLYADGDQSMVRSLCQSMQERHLYCQLHDAATLTPVR